jgi:gluconate 5-dehydrogenase
MSIDPELKMNRYGIEKYLLRHAFEEDKILPEGILWRQKAAFSDAVGHSLVDEMKAHAEALYTDEEFLKILDVHVLSVFALSREALKAMLPRKRGSIIMISSMTAIMGMEKVVAYSTAKTAVNGMMRALIADASASGIRVNAIAPVWIDTPMLHKAIDNDAPRRDKILARIPTRAFGRVEDIGYAAQYLASDAGAYVNGVFLPVDAGAAGAF